MKICGRCKIEKSLECFGKDITSKDGLRCICKECRKEESKKRYKKDKEALSKYYKERYKENTTKFIEKNKVWKDNNKERRSEVNKIWRNVNKEHVTKVNKQWYEDNKEKVSLYKKNNRGIYNYASAKRTANIKKRTPSYANLRIIKELYIYANFLTKTTGREYHVDHIIPLHGEVVSGFHIESNLQVIPKEQNLKKSNAFIFDGGFYGSCLVEK